MNNFIAKNIFKRTLKIVNNNKHKKIIYAALIGNLAITMMKFFAASVSGSSAMLAEAFHSTADSGNQIMMLLGLARSKKAPDGRHPFGYSKELYFWAFIVAVSIFFVGAVLSIFEGIHKILHPQPIVSFRLTLIVLGLSALFEAYPWFVALREARKIKTGTGTKSYINMAVKSKNPTVMVVLFEDTAALVGLFAAFIGISLAHYLQMSVIDGITSIIIGIILLVVALFLARETKELLIGESASRADRYKMYQAVSGIPEVCKCGRLMTMHLGPDDILVNLEVEFKDNLSTDEVESAIDKIELEIKKAVPAVGKIYIEAESLRKGLADK
ncbi:hypothetical protein BuS5_00071 [Desulfosarcina sp. BuS5]|uniref:cation diffusion facilitator family transporter n=1 Tax=Desulfosarcina sp. BuS5 TaxID=933262 RepID=UPI0012FB59EA|nr:cation diffusion facilitator family transporter [Desulfosarcina sp. BuS5]WDN87103.1 hypothetical protein BuS5_00071 [Desulfosarcina sp. BuS5]